MIRAFYIFCKLNLIKISDKDIYDRNMITISEGLRLNLTVSVPRIKCGCGRTHAIIPDILIPYGSYSL